MGNGLGEAKGDGSKAAPEGWDSAEFVDGPPVAPSAATRSRDARAVPMSGHHKAEDAPIVAIAIDSPAVREPIAQALREGLVKVRGPDGIVEATVVITEQASDDAKQLAAIRKAARHDAAILVVLADPSAQSVANAHDAGAFACLRTPIVPEEVLGLVTAALDSRSSKVQVANLERKLNLQEHLASLGRMSAGLAHEIGGPLSAAVMNMEVVRSESGRLAALLDRIVRAAPEEIENRVRAARGQLEKTDCAGGLTLAIDDTIAAHERLKTVLTMMRGLVGRVREPRRERVDLLRVIDDTLAALAADLRGIEVEVIGEPVAAIADEALVSQILRNLTSNAARAARSLSSPRVRLHAYVSGDTVVASVRDNGPGIAADMHEKIFEPFFTTRRGEGGTGIGLAMCREYALQMKAEIALWSVPGRGSCFRLFLPPAR